MREILFCVLPLTCRFVCICLYSSPGAEFRTAKAVLAESLCKVGLNYLDHCINAVVYRNDAKRQLTFIFFPQIPHLFQDYKSPWSCYMAEVRIY